MTSRPNLSSASRPALPAWAQVSPDRVLHIQRVAELVDRWAEEMRVSDSERARWLRAVWLHDALRDAPQADLDRLAPGPDEPAELKHGPASAALAKGEGETDRGVLDAVHYHSVGLVEWDLVGRMLFCADFLEPGRSFERAERTALAGRLPSDPRGVLLEVARRRMLHAIKSGWSVPEPSYRFWNSLVSASSSSSR